MDSAKRDQCLRKPWGLRTLALPPETIFEAKCATAVGSSLTSLGLKFPVYQMGRQLPLLQEFLLYDVEKMFVGQVVNPKW